MPNLATGDIEIKGKFNDIKNFLLNGIDEENSFIEKRNEKEVWFENKNINLSSGIKGTSRCGISHVGSAISINQADKNEEISIMYYIEAAWNVYAEEFKEISKKYNIDFFMTVEEPGSLFGKTIEIIEREIIQNETFYLEEEDEYWD